MAIVEDTIRSDSPSLDELRAFLKLPIDERRRIMQAQAALLVHQYQDEPAQEEREQWQAGDIVEY